MSTVSELLERNGWGLEETGGGCTAYTKIDGSRYWMLTRQGDAVAPESMGDPVTVGRYDVDSSDPIETADFESLQYWADSHYLA